MNPNWAPFKLCDSGQHAPAPRAVTSPDGIGDRLRAAAFAEIQARDAFNWAAEQFTDAPSELRNAWRMLAKAEQRHLDWLLQRMSELGVKPEDRAVSDHLWSSFMSCNRAEDFAIFMANAEERGRRAGERFHQAMAQVDPISAEIFGKIAAEEIEHIEIARRFFPTHAGLGKT